MVTLVCRAMVSMTANAVRYSAMAPHSYTQQLDYSENDPIVKMHIMIPLDFLLPSLQKN